MGKELPLSGGAADPSREPPSTRRGTARRVLFALGAVAALAALGALLVTWTRDSPYRGRLAARAAGVELTRNGKTFPLRTLEVVDLLAGDQVRTGPEGSALVGWAAGPEALLGGGVEMALLAGPAEVELRSGRMKVTAPAPGVEVVLGGRRYTVRGQQVVVTPERVEAAGGSAEVSVEGRPPLRLEPGRSAPWPQ